MIYKLNRKFKLFLYLLITRKAFGYMGNIVRIDKFSHKHFDHMT